MKPPAGSCSNYVTWWKLGGGGGEVHETSRMCIYFMSHANKEQRNYLVMNLVNQWILYISNYMTMYD